MRTSVAIAAALLAVPVALTGGPGADAGWARALQSSVGTPISGTPVGLEGDPGSIHVAAGDVNGDGRAELMWERRPGATGVRVFLPDRARLSVPAIVRIESGRQNLVSAPILPGKGRGYASDAKGKPLVVLPSGEARQSVRITLTQAPVMPRGIITLTGNLKK